jgi:hypothetical protein
MLRDLRFENVERHLRRVEETFARSADTTIGLSFTERGASPVPESHVERCIYMAFRQIELAMLPGATDTNWRWGLAETWFRTAEKLMRRGVR